METLKNPCSNLERGGFARSMIQSPLMTTPPSGRAISSTYRKGNMSKNWVNIPIFQIIGSCNMHKYSSSHACAERRRERSERVPLNTDYYSNLTANCHITRLCRTNYSKIPSIQTMFSTVSWLFCWYNSELIAISVIANRRNSRLDEVIGYIHLGTWTTTNRSGISFRVAIVLS